MKKIINILILSIVIISCNNSTNQKPIQTDEEAVVEVENLIQNIFDDIWSGYDETSIKKYHTENFLLLEHGEVWNNDTIANWCKRSKNRISNSKRINSFERIDAKRNGDKLWLAYHNYAIIKTDSLERKLSWLESVVAIKQDSVWKLELMHSTRNTKR